MTSPAVVVIGRNEGERLRLCLESVAHHRGPVVYVDSGSTDASVATARSLGAEVVELDTSTPFSAARARNAGFDRLSQIAPEVAHVQFVDGDCEVVAGWLDRACAELGARPDVAVVCGRVRERHPERSIYNRMADLEWDTPIGESDSCGGIFAIRARAFRAVGRFDPALIAGEEPELCHRLRAAGWGVVRLDSEMARHDLDMTRLGQWWRRQARFGYACVDVTAKHRGGPFCRQILSTLAWSAGWPLALAVIIGLAAYSRSPRLATAASILALAPAVQALRIAAKARRCLPSRKDALAYGGLIVAGKWAEATGQVRYARDRMAGRRARLIEYKAAPIAPPALRT